MAWIASTPITDVAAVFEREFRGVRRAPGWVLGMLSGVAVVMSKSAAVSLEKYALQFGTRTFADAVAATLAQARTVDDRLITCPTLLLMGEGEGAELRRQTEALYGALKGRGQDVTLHDFTAQDGADAHCQVNNLRLAHAVVFDWLDRVFGWGGRLQS